MLLPKNPLNERKEQFSISDLELTELLTLIQDTGHKNILIKTVFLNYQTNQLEWLDVKINRITYFTPIDSNPSILIDVLDTNNGNFLYSQTWNISDILLMIKRGQGLLYRSTQDGLDLLRGVFNAITH